MFQGKGLAASILIFMTLVFSGCAGLDLSGSIEKTQVAYEKVGNKWGKILKEEKRSPATNLPNEYIRQVCEYAMQKEIDKVDAVEYFKRNNVTKEEINPDFIYSLFSRNNIDYFNVHAELKDSFKKGFRLGYEDRIADLVLGPHLSTTAACIGMSTSQDFVDVITEFEDGWISTIRNAIDTFIVLISEGSQADRERFIKHFIDIYTVKYGKTQELKAGGAMSQLTAGGTTLYIDMSKDAASAVMDIPSPEGLKGELYRQTFKVMGDEWGRRYATNLIKRDELVDLLRRVKPVLSEIGDSRENLEIIRKAFVDQYTADGSSTFRSMINDAGIDVAMLQVSPASGISKKR